MTDRTKRRKFVKGMVGLSGATAVLGFLALRSPLRGNVNHSVCRWCFADLDLDELCRHCREIGIKAVDLVGADDWPTLAKHGLQCSMANGADMGIPRGFNRLEHHDKLVAGYERLFVRMREHGVVNAICFSGNRFGMDSEQGLENCVIGIKRLMKTAESARVTLHLELLNSFIDHPDYMADNTRWGVELCQRIGSDSFKLLFDIYHMATMGEDVISAIHDNHACIGHYHTGGVPGRGEIDGSQGLDYPAIVRAILDTGFTGFVAQEFIPKKPDALRSLKDAVRICDV